ncbi:MAG: hypothetical protein LBQ12_04345, partial [Deltaproteobacteria bacterium]|nr:hypothetical protein [Deltaproteobacteria bacterium]
MKKTRTTTATFPRGIIASGLIRPATGRKPIDMETPPSGSSGPQLGPVEWSLLASLVSMLRLDPGDPNILFCDDPPGEVCRSLRDRLAAPAGSPAPPPCKDTWYGYIRTSLFLIRENGCANVSTNRLKEALCRMESVRIPWKGPPAPKSPAGKRDAGTPGNGGTAVSLPLLAVKRDHADGQLRIGLHPAITSAALAGLTEAEMFADKAIPYTTVPMDEQRMLKGNTARLVHAFLCEQIWPGRAPQTRILCNLLDWIWGEDTDGTASARRQRRHRRLTTLKKALREISELDAWTIWETAPGKFAISRAKASLPAIRLGTSESPQAYPAQAPPASPAPASPAGPAPGPPGAPRRAAPAPPGGGG